MHRINTPTATSNNRFTEGDPTIPIQPTVVSADWLNAVQEELASVIEKAGLTLDAANNAQVFAAIQQLIALKTTLATVEKAGLVKPDGITIQIDANGTLSLVGQSAMDPVGGIRFFDDEQPRTGYVPCNGTALSAFSATYPEMAAYLGTSYGAKRLVTKAQYDALHVATFAALADGTKIGWDGIGGVTKFVWDKNADTLLMPDLAGMLREAAGYDTLGMGDVHGDCIRDVYGSFGRVKLNNYYATGAVLFSVLSNDQWFNNNVVNAITGDISFLASRQVPVGNANKTRAWGALACCFLGQPAS